MNEQKPDQSREFLDRFPRISPDHSFSFACHPSIECFNACCSGLDLRLTPYDVLRLRKRLNINSREFVKRYGTLSCSPETGLPAIRLTMKEDREQSCPFLTPQGCSVYPDRPGACRTYPVGRATRIDEDGTLVEEFFLIEEPHCKGFKEARHWHPHQWIHDQGLDVYNRFNDLFTLLMSDIRDSGRPIPPKMMPMVVMALYHLDDFQHFLKEMKVLDKLGIDRKDARQVLSDEEKTLDFSFKWMDTVLFNKSPLSINKNRS